MQESTTKPPLGVTPRKIWLRGRKEDLQLAIYRYAVSEHVAPQEWLEELYQITEELRG